jgi:hypothetical protein
VRRPNRGYHGAAPPGLNTHRPPFLTYDPALEAERRASERGLQDLEKDTRIARLRARQDWRTDKSLIRRDRTRSLGDLQRDYGRGVLDTEVDYGRGVEDTERGYARGLEDIGFQRQDLNTDLQRGRQDFATQLQSLSRQYGNLGSSQRQAINASGVALGGAHAAAAKRRAANQAFDEQPIRTGQQRLEEDFATQLSRLGTTESRLGEERATSLGRLGTDRSLVLGRLGEDRSTTGRRLRQDFRTDLRLGRRDYRRTGRDLALELERARREQAIGDVDITHSQIFQAQQLNPGAFSKGGRRR